MAEKRTPGAEISPMTFQSPSFDHAPACAMGSATLLGSPTLITVPPEFVDPMLAFVDEWCLEEDCSVLKPQLQRRLPNGPTSALDFADDVTADPLLTSRLETNIGKKISAAILRRLRVTHPLEDDTASNLISPRTPESSSTPRRGSVGTDAFAVSHENNPLHFSQFDSPNSAMDCSQSFDTTSTAIFPSPTRASAASPGGRETRVRKELIRCIASLATVTMDATRKLHEARHAGRELRRELAVAHATVNDLKASVGRRSLTNTHSHLLTTRRASGSNEGSMPPPRRRSTKEGPLPGGVAAEAGSIAGSVGVDAGTRARNGAVDSGSVEEESLRPPPLAVETSTPVGSVSLDPSTGKNGRKRKSLSDVMLAMTRELQATNQPQHQPNKDSSLTPHSDSATPRAAVNPFAAAMSVKSLMAAGFPLTPQTLRTPNIIHNNHAELSIDDIGMPMLNQYLFLSEIGSGCQGSVSLALDTETQDLRAIKVIPRPPIKDDVSEKKRIENTKKMSQLRREIAIMKRCRHKNVVTLYEVIDDEEAEAMYLVMQYVEKGPVATISATGGTTPIAPHRLATFSHQLCSGLLYLHSRGIVHRDIKPDNILLGNNDTVYLADFGISSIENGDAPGDSSTSPTARKASHRVQRGTIAFLAPELLRDDPKSSGGSPPVWFGPTPPAAAASPARGEPVDVWALGLSIYLLLYGILPWKLDSMVRYVNDVVNTPIEFPNVVQHSQNGAVVEVPLPLYDEWLALLQGMLNRDEKKRFTAEQAYRVAKHLHQRSDMCPPLIAEASPDAVVDDADIGAAITAVRRGL